MNRRIKTLQSPWYKLAVTALSIAFRTGLIWVGWNYFSSTPMSILQALGVVCAFTILTTNIQANLSLERIEERLK